MVFPEPTSPYMYIPFGRFASLGGSEKEAGDDGERREEKKDFLAGWRDSMVGWRTVGCVHVASMTCKSSRFLMMSVILSAYLLSSLVRYLTSLVLVISQPP
jgi:hypothetical protein